MAQTASQTDSQTLAFDNNVLSFALIITSALLAPFA